MLGNDSSNNNSRERDGGRTNMIGDGGIAAAIVLDAPFTQNANVFRQHMTSQIAKVAKGEFFPFLD